MELERILKEINFRLKLGGFRDLPSHHPTNNLENL
jgi:hypothetical protein